MKSADTKVAVNYTPELETLIKSLYDGGNGMSIKDIAADPRVNKPEKSVRGKLVHMGVYVKPAVTKVAEYKDEGPTKKDQLAVLKGLGFSEDALKGLNNATKNALAEVIARVSPATVEADEADEAQAA